MPKDQLFNGSIFSDFMTSLLIILLIFNLVFWVLVIWFRILFECEIGKCCRRSSSAEIETSTGHRNAGFVDSEDLHNSRPSTISERMESPPSYEEALKYEQFGFHSSPPLYTSSQPCSASALPFRQDEPRQIAHAAASEESSTAQTSQSSPRLAERSRSSTSTSNSFLTPIREEDIDDMPVTVVIDTIGVQASRLLEHCDTTIDIAGGETLNDHSKC